ERSYPIHIGAGLLSDAALYAPHVKGKTVGVVTNAIVQPLYLARVQDALTAAGARSIPGVVEGGEEAKSWRAPDQGFEAALEARLGRDAVLVALGGGVVGDLAGFAAATYQRGIPYLQLPTTLLAQVDSSVGGKTAINHALGKNMVGAFHQPLAVIADVATLDTLPDRELRAGLAEVIKHALALDLAFVEWLETNIGKVLNRERPALTYVVKRCCELKAGIVAADERESGVRALLNFGHTFGHAIEAGMGYGTWLHGEAIGAGMAMAAELSLGLNLIGKTEVDRVKRLLARAGLPSHGPALAPERLMELMAGDKKAAQGKLRFVVLEALGKAALRG